MGHVMSKVQGGHVMSHVTSSHGHVPASQDHVEISEFGLLGYSFAFGPSLLRLGSWCFGALRASLATTLPFATRRTSRSRTSRRPSPPPPLPQSHPQPRLRTPSPLYLQQPPRYSSLFPASKKTFRWTSPSSLISSLHLPVFWNRSATPTSTLSSTKEAAKSGVPKTNLPTETS